jgi:simple sugar transport system permease protein
MENRTNEFKTLVQKNTKAIAYPLIAIILSFIVGGIIVAVFGNDPIVAYKAMFKGSLGSWSNFGETLVSVTPLILTGLSVAFAFRCGLFNIGAEGQFIIGSVAAVWAGWAIKGIPALLHIIIVLLVGAAAGGIWGGVVGWLKAKVGSHEVINSIMMNYIAMYFSNYVVMNLMNEPDKAFSYAIADTAKLWRFAGTITIFKGSRVHIGIFIALIVAVLAYYLLNKTVRGYEIRAVGFNPHAAEYGGINVPRNVILAMFISGVFAGLAGAIMVTGVQFRVNNLFGFTGYGLDGIAVALVGNNHPLGVILSAFLFGVLQKGGPMMQLQGVPKEVVGIIQGIVILFVAVNFIKIMIENYTEKQKIKKSITKGEVE